MAIRVLPCQSSRHRTWSAVCDLDCTVWCVDSAIVSLLLRLCFLIFTTVHGQKQISLFLTAACELRFNGRSTVKSDLDFWVSLCRLKRMDAISQRVLDLRFSFLALTSVCRLKEFTADWKEQDGCSMIRLVLFLCAYIAKMGGLCRQFAVLNESWQNIGKIPLHCAWCLLDLCSSSCEFVCTYHAHHTYSPGAHLQKVARRKQCHIPGRSLSVSKDMIRI